MSIFLPKQSNFRIYISFLEGYYEEWNVEKGDAIFKMIMEYNMLSVELLFIYNDLFISNIYTGRSNSAKADFNGGLCTK